MDFISTYEHSIDSKNRMAVPMELRRQLEWNTASAHTPVSLFVSLGDDQSLCIFEEAVFKDRARQLRESRMDPAERVQLERKFFGLTTRVELDPQGRIRIPDHLMKLSRIGTDVVIFGSNDHLEVRDRKTWMSELEQSIKADPKLWTNLQRAIGQGSPSPVEQRREGSPRDAQG